MKKGIYLLGLGVLLLLCMDLQAKVRLPHFFSSNMVLQRDMPIRVWGKADKNEVISVALEVCKRQKPGRMESGGWNCLL